MSMQGDSAAGANQRRILIVDDTEDNRIILDRQLRSAGFATELAEDGRQAIAAISRRMPSLVLLDWMMPHLSGLDTLRAIRERADGNTLPVIMCTAVGEDVSIVAAFKAGVTDFVQKPINFPILAARIKSHLERAKSVTQMSSQVDQLEQVALDRTRDLLSQFRPARPLRP